MFERERRCILNRTFFFDFDMHWCRRRRGGRDGLWRWGRSRCAKAGFDTNVDYFRLLGFMRLLEIVVRGFGLSIRAVAFILIGGHRCGVAAFLAPAMPGASQLTTATALAAVAVVVPLHLQVATHLGTAARWRVGAIAAGIVLALLLVSHAVATDEFSPMAEFDATIRTVSPALVPQEGLDGFRATRADLKADVDRLLESAAR